MRSDLIRVVICGAGLALAGQAVAQAKITGVETRQVGDSLKLQVVGEGLKKPKTLRGKDGKSFIIEFNGTLATKGQKVSVYEGGLRAFKYGWYKSKQKLVRLQYWPDQKVQPKVLKNLDGWFVTWAAPKSALATPIAAAKPAISTLEAAGTAGILPANPGATDVSHAKKIVPGSAGVSPAKQTLGPDKPSKVSDTLPTEKKTASVIAEKTKPVASKTTTAPQTITIVPKVVAAPPKTGPKTVTPKAPKAAGKVSLDFVNTDIVQILRALAIQSRVNIVTSPDVKGSLSVALSNVTVSEALDLVTTLAGLAYDMVGKTYVVAAKNKIVEIIRDAENSAPMAVTSMVVPIFSGEGTQIKAAILRTVRGETEDGSFEIMLPSEETKVEKKTEDKGGAEQNGKAEDDKKETKVESKASTTSKDLYVVVMGSPVRVDEVTKMVRNLDQQFCNTMGVDVPRSTAMVQRSYAVKGGSAFELAKAVAGDSKKVGNVDISATPVGSRSEQVIVLSGRENEVEKLMATLSELDSSEQIGAEFVMYDVQFSDPRALREALVAQVPGIRVSIPPASAGNPRLFEVGAAKAMAADRVKDANDSGNGSNGAGQVTVDPKVNRDDGQVTEGLKQPFTEMERAAVPMRLLLRGTPDQVRSAQAYLAVVDIAPKQIALELRVMELSKEDALRVGLDWNIFTGGAVRTVRFNQSSATAGSNSATVGIGGRNWGANVTATLDSIADKQRLIARPNLLAIDGRESEIFVGDIVRYVSSRSTNPTTGEINMTIDEIAVGVRLAVMPRVGAGGSLTMDLRPVVSSITGFLNAGPGVQIPQTSSRVAQSTVNIQSGETIAIGGLIQDTDTRNISKVPFLGDLPIIGHLFRRTDNSRVRREVVFFLTARQVTAGDRQNAADPRSGEDKTPAEIPPFKKGGN